MSGTGGRAWRLAGALCGLVVVLDQGAKAVVEAHLVPGEQVDVLGPLGLTLSHNKGVAFGLAGGGGGLLVAFAARRLVFVGWLFARDPTRPWMWVAVGLLAGGALGNLADRIRAGAVTDYIDICSWPPFNLADVAITAGVFAAGPDPHRGAEVSDGAELRIVHLDDALAVVDKPAGLVVHPAPSHSGPTLVDELGEILGGGGDPSGPGIVHRLDKGTSGLLVVARDDEAHARPAGAGPRAARSSASTWRSPAAASPRAPGTIDAPIGRASRQRHRMAVSGAASRAGAHPLRGARAARRARPTSRPAWRPAARTRSAPTSRRSAIRCSATRPMAASSATGSSGQFLHAHRLAFAHPVSGRAAGASPRSCPPTSPRRWRRPAPPDRAHPSTIRSPLNQPPPYRPGS